jgi:hypothetical protein
MDDRNGECFENHENISSDGPINTCDSEHECLKDFLLEPRSAIRNMPCSTDSDRVDNVLSGQETQMTTQNDLGREDLFENCTDFVNSSSERTQECEIPLNCGEPITSQNSCSSIAETTNSEDERNGSYRSLSINIDDLTNPSESLKDNKLRDNEGSQLKGETKTAHSSAVQKDIDNEKTSTKCTDNQLHVSKKLTVVSHEPKVQESPKSENECQDGEVESTRSFECSNTPKGRYTSSRGRKRKGAEVTTARGRPPGPAKKKKQPVTYQSQISPDQNGIKIRIKKSSASPTVIRPPRRRDRGKKRKSKKGSNTEDEESDIGSNKQVKWKDQSVNEESEADEFGEQSDWGLRMPRQMLYDIFFMVTQEEGCLPFLIRLYFLYTSIYVEYNISQLYRVATVSCYPCKSVKEIVARQGCRTSDDFKQAVSHVFNHITPQMLWNISHRTWRKIILCHENDRAQNGYT